MKKIKKKFFLSINKLLPILILGTTIFMSIGYASVNSVIFNIEGTATAMKQEGIFITEINYISDINANLNKTKILNAYHTNLNSNIVLSNTDINSQITYSITILNNTDKDYIFDDTIYDENFYSNNNIIFFLSNLSHGYELYSKDTVTFQITFKYDNNVTLNDDINSLESFLNFKFIEATNITFTYKNNTIKKLVPLSTGNITLDDIIIDEGTIIRCNQNAIPTFSNNIITTSNINTPTNCQVFSTLKEAIETSDTTTNNLLMIADEDATEAIVIDSTKKINVDINGKTNISNITKNTEEESIYITNNGNLSFKDSQGTGLMKTNYYLFINNNNLTIDSGNYKKENASSTIGAIVKSNGGIVNINNATIESDKTYAIFTSGSKFTEIKINNSIVSSNGTSGGAVSNTNAKSIISIMNSTISNTKNGAVYTSAIGASTFICGSKINGGNYDILVYDSGGGNVQYTSNNTFMNGTSNPQVSTPLTYDIVKNNLNICIDDWYRVKDINGNNITYLDGNDILVGHKLQIASSINTSLVFDNSNGSEIAGNQIWLYTPWEEDAEQADAQRFIILPSNDLQNGYYNIAMYFFPDFYISNYEGTSSNGNKVAIMTSENNNETKFKIVNNGSFNYSFKSYYNTCIDVPAGSAEEKLYLQMYTCNQTNAQNWKLTRYHY